MLLPWSTAWVLALACGNAGAQVAAPPPSQEAELGPALQDALALTRSGIKAPQGARLEVIPGRLDPRLRLAPCRKVEPYLPAGSPPWGRTRVGLRCVSGAVPWNVYLPVTVQVWAPALVTRAALANSATLTVDDLVVSDVDVAAESSPTHQNTADLVGRQLSTALPPGTAVRAHHLRIRSWFAAGETVTVLTAGTGFGISTSGQAMTQGLEGQPVRVKTDNGRVLTAWPVGENRVELRQ